MKRPLAGWLLILAALSNALLAADSPPDASALLRESAKLLASGDSTAATARLTAAATRGDNTPEARTDLLLERALDLWALGRTDLAKQELAALHKLSPTAPQTVALRVFLLVEGGEAATALKQFSSDYEKHPALVGAHLLAALRVPDADPAAIFPADSGPPLPPYIGNYLYARGLAEWEESRSNTIPAFMAWRAAALSLPTHAATHEHYLAAATQLATSTGAAALETALLTEFDQIEIAPISSDDVASRTTAALKAGDWATVIQLGRIWADRSRSSEPRIALARAYTNLNLLLSGRRTFAELLRHDAQNPIYLQRLALANARGGWFDEAEQSLKDAIAASHGAPEIAGQNPAALVAQIAKARAAIAQQLPSLLDAMRRDPESPAAWEALANFWLELDVPGRAYACLLPTARSASTRLLTARFWMTCAVRSRHSPFTHRLIARATQLVDEQIETAPANLAAWQLRLELCQADAENETTFLRQLRPLLEKADALKEQPPVAKFIALHNLLQARQPEDFDQAYAQLKELGEPGPQLALWQKRREKLVAGLPTYTAALSDRTAAQKKNDYAAIAEADRRAAEVTPVESARSELHADREIALAMDAFTHALPVTAARHFEAAAKFAPEKADEFSAKATEARNKAAALLDQAYAAKNWALFVAAAHDVAQESPLSADHGIHLATALANLQRVPEAVAALDTVLARSDLSAERRKALTENRQKLGDVYVRGELAKSQQLWKTGRKESAVKILRILAAKFPEYTRLRYMLAERLADTPERAEGVAMLRESALKSAAPAEHVFALRLLYAIGEPPPKDALTMAEIRNVLGDEIVKYSGEVARNPRAMNKQLELWMNPTLLRRFSALRDASVGLDHGLLSRMSSQLDARQKLAYEMSEWRFKQNYADAEIASLGLDSNNERIGKYNAEMARESAEMQREARQYGAGVERINTLLNTLLDD